jgi:phage-related protein
VQQLLYLQWIIKFAKCSFIRNIRVQQGSDIYRIFCFFDDSKIIVPPNGYHKKSQKIPAKEIIKALKIMEEYFNEKG